MFWAVFKMNIILWSLFKESNRHFSQILAKLNIWALCSLKRTKLIAEFRKLATIFLITSNQKLIFSQRNWTFFDTYSSYQILCSAYQIVELFLPQCHLCEMSVYIFGPCMLHYDTESYWLLTLYSVPVSVIPQNLQLLVAELIDC